MIIIDQLFPVFALIAVGAILRHKNWTSDAFLATSDRIIYFIFFPALLFWKIGGAQQTFSNESMRFYGAVLGAILIVYVLSTLYIILFRVPKFQAGSFSQSCYRFNTYVGMAVILTAWGEARVAQFGVLIGLAIPMINVLAVTTLIWFSGQPMGWARRARITLVSLVTNPLILACTAGIVYAHWINTFPRFIENTLRLSATITLPLALISIGGNLTLFNFKRYFPLALMGSVFKLIALPLIGWLAMVQLAVPADCYPVGMLFFALPSSAAMHILSGQLNSDTQLASAALVVSMGLSFFSMSAVLWRFHG